MGDGAVELTFSMFLIVCPMVFLAAFIDSIAGGGGLISLPAYYLAGLSPVMAAGTNKLSAMVGTSVSAVQYIRSGSVNWKVALSAVAGAVPGSMLGARLLSMIPETTTRIAMLCVLPVIAFFVLRKKDSMEPRNLLSPAAVIPVCFLIGLVIGTYDGMIGPGTGTFLILFFLKITGLKGLQSVGSARLVNLSSNIGAFVTMVIGGNVLYPLGIAACVFSIAGNYFGAKCALKSGMKVIRKLLIVVLCLIFAKMLYDLISAG